MEQLKKELRADLDRMIRSENGVVMPEPEEENGSFSFGHSRDYGFDQGWYVGRREYILDILRMIEKYEAEKRVNNE